MHTKQNNPKSIFLENVKPFAFLFEPRLCFWHRWSLSKSSTFRFIVFRMYANNVYICKNVTMPSFRCQDLVILLKYKSHYKTSMHKSYKNGIEKEKQYPKLCINKLTFFPTLSGITWQATILPIQYNAVLCQIGLLG